MEVGPVSHHYLQGTTDFDLMDLGGWQAVAIVRVSSMFLGECLDNVMDAFNDNSQEHIYEQ